TLVSIRFSVNQSVHFEVLLVKLAEMIKTQPQTVQNVATASVANEPDNEMLLQRLEQLENELKTLKEQGIKANKVNKQPKKPTRT
ncbi:DNA polymerase III subunit gamma/tau, partial [Staphylococcus pettenkoferi]